MSNLRPYSDMTDEDLMSLGKKTLVEAAAEKPRTIERAMKFAAYDSIVAELQRRLANRIAADLGLPEIDN